MTSDVQQTLLILLRSLYPPSASTTKRCTSASTTAFAHRRRRGCRRTAANENKRGTPHISASARKPIKRSLLQPVVDNLSPSTASVLLFPSSSTFVWGYLSLHLNPRHGHLRRAVLLSRCWWRCICNSWDEANPRFEQCCWNVNHHQHDRDDDKTAGWSAAETRVLSIWCCGLFRRLFVELGRQEFKDWERALVDAMIGFISSSYGPY